MKLQTALSAAFVSLAAFASCGDKQPATGSTASSSKTDSGAKKSITVWWFQWDPATGLAELGREYEKETGVAVKVEQIPIASYQEKVFLEFGGSKTGFDIVIGDSQWIGRGATKGLYVDLTSWLPTVVDLKSIHPRAAKYLCEYPENSGKWFAAPCETDAVGMAYRKDWFDDPKEKADFKAKYDRDLVVPASWEDFKQVAEFFHRPDQKRYGCAIPTDRNYDGLTMGFQNVLWAFGGKWKDENSNKVVGFLDTRGTADAVEFFKELMKLGPKGCERIDYGQVLESFTNGSTAMVLNYFAFFPSIQAKFGDKVGFAVVPAHSGVRVASLGGQGMSISTKVSSEQQELAKQFIAWFLKRETQEQWITKPAGFTANTEILKSAAFRAKTPYNAPFADSVETMRDFWNVPVYNELLAAAQRFVGMAVDGEMPTAEALSKLAIEQERILKEAGLL